MPSSRALMPVLLAAIVMPSAVSAHDVTAAANAKVRASFDILQAKAETDGNKVTFIMTTRGTAGAEVAGLPGSRSHRAGVGRPAAGSKGQEGPAPLLRTA